MSIDLAARLRANPDDLDAWAVWADDLQAKGDPTGELCLLEVQRETGADSPEREARVRALLLDRQSPHPKEAWHPLDARLAASGAEGSITLTWRFGHLRSARLAEPWTGGAAQTRDLLEALVDAPAARFLRALRLERQQPSKVPLGELGSKGEVDWLGESVASMPSVTSLHLGSGDPDADGPIDAMHFSETSSWMVTGKTIRRPPRWLGDVQHLFPSFPRLTELTLHGEGIAFTTLPPSLRALAVRSRFVRASTLERLGATPMPELETLRVWCGHWPDSIPDFPRKEGDAFYGPETGPEHLTALLSGLHVPALRHLELSNNLWTPELIPALAEAPLLRQLVSLDLSYGLVDEVGARLMLRHADAFRHLERVDLRFNRIFDASVVAELKRTFRSVVLRPQERLSGSEAARLFMR